MKSLFRRIISLCIVVLMIANAFPAAVFAAENEMDIKLSTVSGCPGETVSVAVELSNNPGIASLKFSVSYDDANLTLTAVSFAEGFGSYVTAPTPYKNPQTLSFVSPLEEVTINGLFATLTFTISPEAEDNVTSDIVVSYDADDVFDGDCNNVKLNITNGQVNIYHGIPGDINGDKVVNNKDAILLFRYVAGWNVEVDYGALDVNGDGKANNKDAITLFRYVAGWEGITLVRGKLCDHVMEATEANAATCTENGNIAYWQCTVCGKYFSDANGLKEITAAETILEAPGHTPVIDPAVPATTTSTGLTEGSHCSVCLTVLVAQEVTPMLPSKTHTITYDIANGDTYLASLLQKGEITNSNPDRFSEESALTLRNLSVDGYRFLGWYDGQGDGQGNYANKVTMIEQGTTEDIELYAHWGKITYKVQYKSSLFLEKDEDTYTVDTGLVLPTPKLSNYVFTGWADENGKLYQGKTIPVGTTGNITLEGNWMSERNKTWTKTSLDTPIIYEDEEANILYFVYEVGEIQNVPLSIIHDFGYISEGGIEKSETTTYTTTITKQTTETIANTVAKATTESSNWTLSSAWNETTDVSEEWCNEKGMTKDEAKTIATSESQNWNVSTCSSGSTDTSHVSTNQNGWENQAKISSSKSTTESSKVNATLESSLSTNCLGVKAEVKGSLSTEDSISSTKNSGFEIGGAKSNTDINTDSTATNTSWSSNASYGGSKQNSQSTTTSTAISEKITNRYGYGKSYTSAETSGESQGLTSTTSGTNEWSNSVTYITSEGKSVTNSWSTKATKGGYHRWIVAGTAHVFAVVGYNMANEDYFVYTYSVMDDETHEFEDYSYTTAAFNDQENGVISFEIPYEVADYVTDRTSCSAGLKVDQNTGEVTGYTGTDTCVVIPEYMNVGNGDVVKITGIREGAFAGNTNITVVVLSDYIEKIPKDAFLGCTSLVGVIHGSVKEIGDNAFAGCTSMMECGVRSQITKLGTNAFAGVECLYVNPASAEVMQAAVSSGANKIILSFDALTDTSLLSGETITVPESTEYFEFNGYGKTFTDLTLNSNAAETVVNKANFISTGSIPLRLASPKAVLNQVTVKATGIAMVLTAENAEVGLQGTISVSSDNTNVVLCRNVTLYESNPNVDGRLAVSDKILVCGDVTGKEYLTYRSYEIIDEETFDNLLNSYTLHFDANGGICDETSREVANSTALGSLPTPTKQYYTFAGWYMEDGTLVAENTVFSTGCDQTVYAHWTPNTFTLYFDTTGGTCSESSKAMSYGESIGALPIPTRDYYNFLGWFLDDATQVSEDTVFDSDSDRTIYAHWEEKALSDWVLASELPEDAAVVNEKWTYNQTSYTESRETSLAGYTQYDSYWVKSGSGSAKYASFPSGFDTSHSIYTSFAKSAYSEYENTTAKRVVSNSWTGYVYWHWMYDTNKANGTSTRAIYNKYGWGENGYLYQYFGAFTDSNGSYSSDTGYCNSLGIRNYIVPGRTAWSDCQGATRWFRFDYYTSSYTDYYKMFKYSKVDALESNTDPIADGLSNISDVQHWVRYREK
ncbi:MAG: InlB B-repeat-containing protein [Faecousia sp.]